MQKNSGFYNINQSPFYKLTSHSRLVKVLKVSDIKTLNKIIDKADNNYYFSKLDSGREIEVPKQQLSRIHKRINRLLTKIKPPEYVNSGVIGRSNVKNARDHIGSLTLLKIDIKKYYPSVTQDQVFRCFQKQFKCTNDIADTLARLCCVANHLPTGSQLSQSLSFAVNRPIFDHINIYSKSKKVKFTCYVDDLTFSGNTITTQFKEYISSYIKQSRNYSCHKIRLHKPETPKSVTGVIIEGNSLKVKNKHRNKIHRLLQLKSFMLKRYDPDAPELIRFFQILQGHLFSAGQINFGYKMLGYRIVAERKLLSIPALNQNTI
jgi:hypothetical protein